MERKFHTLSAVVKGHNRPMGEDEIGAIIYLIWRLEK